MNKPTANWHVITGAPGVGKTVLIDLLAKRGYATVPEAAKLIIDEGLAQGKSVAETRGNEQAWQAAILQRILDTEATIDPNQLTFFDRGAHDGLAHLHYYKVVPGDNWQRVLHANPYQTVFLLEPLDDVKKEYFRPEDLAFAKKITGMMAGVYRQAGIEPILIPALPPKERLALILQHLDLPKSPKLVSG